MQVWRELTPPDTEPGEDDASHQGLNIPFAETYIPMGQTIASWDSFRGPNLKASVLIRTLEHTDQTANATANTDGMAVCFVFNCQHAQGANCILQTKRVRVSLCTQAKQRCGASALEARGATRRCRGPERRGPAADRQACLCRQPRESQPCSPGCQTRLSRCKQPPSM